MTAFSFSARDLWATQVPYMEQDRVTPASVAVTRELIHAAQWRAYLDVFADATRHIHWAKLGLNSNVRADAEVVTP